MLQQLRKVGDAVDTGDPAPRAFTKPSDRLFPDLCHHKVIRRPIVPHAELVFGTLRDIFRSGLADGTRSPIRPGSTVNRRTPLADDQLFRFGTGINAAAPLLTGTAFGV